MGPKYILYSHMDPWGQLAEPENFNRVWAFGFRVKGCRALYCVMECCEITVASIVAMCKDFRVIDCFLNVRTKRLNP